MSTSSLRDERSEGRQIGLWLWFLGLSFWPRLFIFGFWIFGSTIGKAFHHGWIVPVIGFLVAPWTTFTYAWMWGLTSNGVHGWEWIVVGFGVLLDLWMWGSLQRIRASW